MKIAITLVYTVIVLSGIILIPNAFAESVPDWVKNTAGWWAEDAISETEFVNAIEFLVKKNIIQINVSQTSETSQLPDWLVNNAGWWAARIFTNSNFNFDPGYIKEEIYPCDEPVGFGNGATDQSSSAQRNLATEARACIEITYNSHGFRGNEFEKEKPDNTFRIFTLGGSTTEGVGAEDDETWPAHLQQIINEKITGKNIEVINFGLSGATSETEYSLIKNKIAALEPDLIIMYDGWNEDATQVEKTVQNWESVCKLGKNEGFDTIIIVQPIVISGQRVTTEQEIENIYNYRNVSQLPYSQM